MATGKHTEARLSVDVKGVDVELTLNGVVHDVVDGGVGVGVVLSFLILVLYVVRGFVTIVEESGLVVVVMVVVVVVVLVVVVVVVVEVVVIVVVIVVVVVAEVGVVVPISDRLIIGIFTPTR